MPYNNQTLPSGYRPPDNTSSLPVPPGFNQSGGGTGQYYQQPQDPYSDPRMHMTGPPQMGTGGFNPQPVGPGPGSYDQFSGLPPGYQPPQNMPSPWFNPWQLPQQPQWGQQQQPWGQQQVQQPFNPWQIPPPGYDPFKDPNMLGELPPPGYYDDQGNRQFPPIGLPPLPPGYQIPGQPPIGLPPLPPPGYNGDNVMNPVQGQYGQPIGGNTTLPYPTPNPAQLNIPPQYQGSMLRSGAGTTTPQKRIPKGSMYGGMERL